MIALGNSHTNATRIGWHLWEIELIFAPGLPPGWFHAANVYYRRVARLRKAEAQGGSALSSYTKVYSVIYDSGSVPEKSIFSPRGTSQSQENRTANQPWVYQPRLLRTRKLTTYD